MKKNSASRWQRCFQRLRWVAVILVVPACSLAGYHLYLNKRINAALEEARARGIPTTIAELEAQYPGVKEGNDSAKLYEQAFESFTDHGRSAASTVSLEMGESFSKAGLKQTPLPPELLIKAEAVLNVNAEALAHVKEAAKHYDVTFQQDLSIDTPPAYLSDLRALMHLVELEAITTLEKREAEACFDSIGTLFGISRALNHDPQLLSGLVEISFQTKALLVLQNPLGAGLFDEQQLGQLTTLVKNMERDATKKNIYRAQLPEALRNWDKAWVTTAMLSQSNLPPGQIQRSSGWIEKVAGPICRISGIAKPDKRYFIESMIDLNEIAEGNTEEMTAKAQKYQAQLSSQSKNMLLGIVEVHPQSTVVLSPLSRMIESHLRRIAQIRVTIVALAVERYRLKYGASPETLDALVPEFLEAVPVGPHHADPLIYNRFDNGYTIYATGANGIDDDGIKYDTPERKGEWLDVPFTVVHQPPGATAP